MRVRFLYTEECSSHEEALTRLRNALRAEAVDATIEISRVETSEDAKKEHYPGSPTILINGRDICPTQSNHFAPTCRAYLLEDGRISPLPSDGIIRRAIRQAKNRYKGPLNSSSQL